MQKTPTKFEDFVDDFCTFLVPENISVVSHEEFVEIQESLDELSDCHWAIKAQELTKSSHGLILATSARIERFKNKQIFICYDESL